MNEPENEPSTKKKTSQSFAKAFKLDIGREKEIIDEKWEVSSGRSLLMNSLRQKLFKYLCEFPCSSLSTIARDLKISITTINWHLSLMVDRKLLSEVKLSGKRLFYPTNMVDEDVIPFLILLADPKIHDIFLKIRESPGTLQKDISNDLGMSHQSIITFSNRLKEVELISIVKDGKYTRYYPTTKILELERDHRKNLKEFRKWIIKSFKFDGVNPKIIRVTDQQLFIQITAGTSIDSLNLSVNPFQTITQDKTRFLSEL
jgi:DNA-binding transcriptional ArsR family regulator